MEHRNSFLPLTSIRSRSIDLFDDRIKFQVLRMSHESRSIAMKCLCKWKNVFKTNETNEEDAQIPWNYWIWIVVENKRSFGTLFRQWIQSVLVNAKFLVQFKPVVKLVGLLGDATGKDKCLWITRFRWTLQHQHLHQNNPIGKWADWNDSRLSRDWWRTLWLAFGSQLRIASRPKTIKLAECFHNIFVVVVIEIFVFIFSAVVFIQQSTFSSA